MFLHKITANMLNEKAEKILNVVLKECSGGYKILCEEDFLSEDNVEPIIRYLDKCGYISLQYAKNGEYLLMPSYRGKQYFAQKNEEYYFRAVLCKQAAQKAFWGAVIGASAASFLLYFITAVLNVG